MFILTFLVLIEDRRNLSHTLAKLSIPGSVAHLIVYGGYVGGFVELGNQWVRGKYWYRASGTCGEGFSDLSGRNGWLLRLCPQSCEPQHFQFEKGIRNKVIRRHCRSFRITSFSLGGAAVFPSSSFTSPPPSTLARLWPPGQEDLFCSPGHLLPPGQRHPPHHHRGALEDKLSLICVYKLCPSIHNLLKIKEIIPKLKKMDILVSPNLTLS